MELTNEHLKAICAVLAETDYTKGFTKAELQKYLMSCKIPVLNDGTARTQYSYTIGLNKKDWLFNCLADNAMKNGNTNNIITFIETCMNPVNFSQGNQRSRYNWLFGELSKVLLFLGIELGKDGKLRATIQSSTLDEVDKRVNSLQRELYVRKIHSSVTKYCTKELLAEDYYHAVHEAAKGVPDRIREMTGLKLDGSDLFNTVFAKASPYIAVGRLDNQSELSEQNGVKELCDSIFQLVRNTTAHRTRVNWDIDETTALDMLSLISLAHKYLDNCIVIKHV